MASQKRQERFVEEVSHLAAEFIERESDGRTLLTVTRSEISPDLKYIVIFFSIFPIEKKKGAVGFLARRAREFPDYLAKHGRFGRLPQVRFVFDMAEVKRQHLDKIFRQIKSEKEDK